MRTILTAIVAVAVSATPLAGQLPKPVDEAERVLWPAIAAVVNEDDPTAAELDALLAKLQRPTPLRGLIQGMRAQALLKADRDADATAAADEAVQLLPGDAWPLFIAADVLTFTGFPARAADYWVRAAAIDPAVARSIDQYAMDALVGRLQEAGDIARADRVRQTMDEIGMAQALAGARSSHAAARFEAVFAKSGAAAALPLISRIIDPAGLLRFYVDRRYEALWPDMARWAGPDFVPMRKRFLETVRNEWWADPDNAAAALPYARQLSQARRYGDLTELFLPLVSDTKSLNDNVSSVFLTVLVVHALHRLGRHAEADALLAGSAKKLAPGAMQLNLSAVRGTEAFRAERWADVLVADRDWLAQAKGYGAGIDRSSLLQVTARDACARLRSGRRADASDALNTLAAAQYTMPEAALSAFQCDDDQTRAAALIVAGLAKPDMQTDMLLLLQPMAPQADETAERRGMRIFYEAMRRRPEVLKAAVAAGRILPRAVPTDLPDGFDPLARSPFNKVGPGGV